MSIGRIAAYVASIVLGLLGLLFFLATASDQNTNPITDGIVGLVLLVIAVAVFWVTMKKEPDTVQKIEITQKIDLAGDTELERLTCKSCGGELDSKAVRVADDGSVMVNCPYCGSAYQITEKPKW